MRSASAALLLPTIGWLACASPDSNDGLKPVTRDSADITILDYSRVAGQPPTWHLDTVPERVIGGSESDPREQLYFVRGVVDLPNGNLVVANGGSNELRWFNRDGGYIRASGRNGEGPGEFRGLTGLTRLAPDSLLAYDSSLRRFQVFDSAGHFVRGFEFSQAERAVSAPQVLGVSDDGQVLVRDLRLDAPEANKPGRVRLTFDILRYDREGHMLDSIVSPSAWEAFNPEPVNGIRVSTLAVPFGFNTLLGATSTEFVFGDTEANEVRALGLDGEVHRVLRPPAAPAFPVTEADIQSYRQRALANVPPTANQLFADIYAQMPLPDDKPRIQSMAVGADGMLWIIGWPAAEGASREALVFDAEWRLSGRLRLPPGFEPAIISADRTIGVVTDDMGIEEVREYQVRRNR